MIVYGLTMQGKKEEFPVKVVAWLLERNSLYLNTIDFTVDVHEVSPEQAEEYKPIAQKYFQIFGLKNPGFGILHVSFLYGTESWSVKIVGGLDKEGNLADRSNQEVAMSLGAGRRAEIADFDAKAEKISENSFGLLRQPANPLKDKPKEMVSLPPDSRWTSEVSMTGAELGSLLSDPQTKEQAGHAIWQKDWQTLKCLKEERS